MQNVPITREEEVRQPGPNPVLWTDLPVLRLPHDLNRYQGRIFVEVWDKDTRLILGADHSLKTRARTALQKEFIPIRDPRVPLTDEPATGGVEGQKFLGRVIVELWDDQEVIGISGGSDSELKNRSIKMLSYD